jgi:hypothetical protein
MTLKYHKTLTKDKWAAYPFYKQILMIANELNRANNWIKNNDPVETRNCYDRAFELLYLTIGNLTARTKLKELVRFKEMLAKNYSAENVSLQDNTALLKVLITFDPQSYSMLNSTLIF